MIVRALSSDDAPDVPAAIVGVDWGTTHRRAWALDAQARPLREWVDDAGMLRSAGRFAAALSEALGRVGPLEPNVRVLLSGMVGSAQGWHQVPYLDAAVPLEALAAHLFVVPDAPPGTDCRIVPGCRWRGVDGTVDVMRGEETQLLGAVALGHRDGRFVLPGTHSKWVALHDGRIEHFATYMTGELFAVMSQHGTLAALMAAPRMRSTASGPPLGTEPGFGRPGARARMHAPQPDEAAFAEGVRAAGRGALSHALFECRARVVAGDMQAASAREHLSGVLIGAEWHDALQRFGRGAEPVCVIASGELAALHRRAALQLGVPVTLLDVRAVQLAAWQALSSPIALSHKPSEEKLP